MSLAETIELIPNYSPKGTAEEDFYFDEAAAQRALDFIRIHLKYVRGEKAGEAFILEPWQASIVANIFGWKKKDGTRRYNTIFIFVPRKSGKSFLLSAILTYIAFCSGEAGSQVYSAAASREQASLIYSDIEAMIGRNPSLSSRASCSKAYKKIEIQAKEKCVFKSLSSEGKVLHGLDIYALCIDELHCIEDREYLAALTTAQGARKNPITIYITTAGVFKPHSPCYEKYDYACKVRDGIIKDTSFLPVIYEADKEDDWTNPKTWKKANPNLGVSVSLDYLKQKCEEAQELPSEQNNFLRLHLNRWTEQLDRWIDMDKWGDCSGTPSTDKDLEWYGGLDMSSTTDLTAFVLAAQDKDGFIHTHCFPFIPKDNAYMRERRDKAPYLTWHKQGFIEMTEGNVIDQDVIRKKIKELGEKYNIKEIAIDRWNTAQITTQLMGDGFTVIPFGQGFGDMSSPTKLLEVLIMSKKLKHGNHPALTWCASNVSIDQDAAECIKPSKKKSTERIDCIVALIMALGRLMPNTGAEAKASIYESRGLLVF